MPDREPLRLPRHDSAEISIIKEFAPNDEGNDAAASSAGKLVIRSLNYGSDLQRFVDFYEVMAEDALEFEPPVELTQQDVEIVRYGGRHYSGTFGMEVSLPPGVQVSDDYTRINTLETLR